VILSGLVILLTRIISKTRPVEDLSIYLPSRCDINLTEWIESC